MARSKPISFEDYDPNTLPLGLWAVYKGNCRRRTGAALHTYSSRGPALNAFAAAYMAKLYKLTTQGWELLAVKSISMRGDACDLCGGSVHDSFKDTWRERERWQWRRDPAGNIAEPPVLYNVCNGCAPIVVAGRV